MSPIGRDVIAFVWRQLTPQLSPEDLHTLWCRRSPRWTGHSAKRPSGVCVDLDTSSTAVQKRTAERVSEESAAATWRRERAAHDAREKADEKQRRQAQRARRPFFRPWSTDRAGAPT